MESETESGPSDRMELRGTRRPTLRDADPSPVLGNGYGNCNVCKKNRPPYHFLGQDVGNLIVKACCVRCRMTPEVKRAVTKGLMAGTSPDAVKTSVMEKATEKVDKWQKVVIAAKYAVNETAEVVAWCQDLVDDELVKHAAIAANAANAAASQDSATQTPEAEAALENDIEQQDNVANVDGFAPSTPGKPVSSDNTRPTRIILKLSRPNQKQNSANGKEFGAAKSFKTPDAVIIKELPLDKIEELIVDNKRSLEDTTIEQNNAKHRKIKAIKETYNKYILDRDTTNNEITTVSRSIANMLAQPVVQHTEVEEEIADKEHLQNRLNLILERLDIAEAIIKKMENVAMTDISSEDEAIHERLLIARMLLKMAWTLRVYADLRAEMSEC